MTVSDTREHSSDDDTIALVKRETAAGNETRKAGPTSKDTTRVLLGGGGSWEASMAASCDGVRFSQNRLGKRMTLGAGLFRKEDSDVRPAEAAPLESTTRR